MKKLNCFFFTLLFVNFLNAQIINIPDANFKTKLLQANSSNEIAKDEEGNNITIDTNGDGEIQAIEALPVFWLNINGGGIYTHSINDLTGLEAFTNLTYLDVGGNTHLTSIDASYLTNLTELKVRSSSSLETINVLGLVNLEHFECTTSNYLTALDLTGLTHLTYLDCSGNRLEELDLSDSNLVNLAYLDCSYNGFLISLNLEGLSNLTTLYCNSVNNDNMVSSLQAVNLSGLTNLSELYLRGHNFSELDFSNFGLINLSHLECSYNDNLTSLNLNGLSNLTYLDCSWNDLATLDLSGLTNLTDLDISYNSFVSFDIPDELVNLSHIMSYHNDYLETLNVSNLISLNTLECNYNNLSSLILSGANNLENLYCRESNLTSLDLSGLSNLKQLTVSGNNLTSLDLLDLTNLIGLDVDNNDILTLDCSANYYLENISFENNPLVYLNIQNGSNYLILANIINDFPNNFYVCIDPSDLEFFNPSDIPDGIHVSVYCSDFPGPNYNTLTGKLMYDTNNDGNCEGEQPQSFIGLNISDGENEVIVYTDTSGNYTYYTQEGNFTLTPHIFENPDLFNVNPPSAVVNFPIAESNIETNNFCISPNGIHSDVEVIIFPLEPARPGFEATYQIFYRNKGNQIESGTIDFNFNDDLMDFNSSSPIQNSQSEGLLSYNFSGLNPFESRTAYLSFQINAPTDTPPVNIGDILTFDAQINIGEDENPDDNTFELNQEVVGSYDPNDILCLEGESVSPEMIGEELHYRIRFENTGNYPAERVVVAMPVNMEDYDVSSFQLLDTSHDVQARIVDNTAEFFFEGIDLQPNEQGYILFSIKSLDSLETGDSVMSYADIYFDYNYPVTTNEAVTTFELMNTKDVNLNNSVIIYPNPAKNQFTIQSEDKIQSIDIYDVTGRLIQISKLNSNQSTQNISKLPAGVYLLKIHTDKGIVTYKLIKK